VFSTALKLQSKVYAFKYYHVDFIHIMPPSTMSATSSGPHSCSLGWNHTIPPSRMAELETPSILNGAMGIFVPPFSFIGVLISYFLAIATSFYIFALIAGFYLQMPFTSVLERIPSGERLEPSNATNAEDPWRHVICGLTALSGVVLTVISFWSFCTSWKGVSEGPGLGFLAALWHGLGVGATVVGFLLVVELVLIALCNYIANVGEKEQEGVKMRTVTASSTQT